MNEALSLILDGRRSKEPALLAGYEKMAARAAVLDERAKAIAECILDTKAPFYNYLTSSECTRIKLAPLFDTTHCEDMFAPGSTELRAVAALIGEEDASVAAYVWRNATRYNYGLGMWRRSFRTKKYAEVYFEKNSDILFGFITGIAGGFTVERYLEECAKGNNASTFAREHTYIGPVLAAHLERGDAAAEKLFERLRDIVNDEAGRATLTRGIIRGLLMSDRDDAHELVANLLLAARLQEGLRQSIMETVDEGDKKAFMRIFRTVMENDLMRFSSVARAFCVWIGMKLDVTAPKAVKGAFETAYRCFTDESFRKGCIDGKNGLDAVIALWATSFEGIEYAEDLARKILRHGPRHKKLAALLFADSLQHATLECSLASECLYNPADRADHEIMAWVARCLADAHAVELTERETLFYNDRFALRIAPDGLKRLYFTLKELVDAFDEKNKKGFVFEDSVVEGWKAEYSRASLLGIMTSLLSFPRTDWVQPRYGRVEPETNEWGIDLDESVRLYTPSADDTPDHPSECVAGMRDDLCSYIDRMDNDTRYRLIRNVAAKGSTPVTRAVLVNALGDRSDRNRAAAWHYVKKLAFTDGEILELENFLRFKDGKIRRYVFLKILMQEPEKLGASIARLLADRDKMRVAAGEELLTLLAGKKDEAKYRKIYANLIAGRAERPNEESSNEEGPPVSAKAGNVKTAQAAKTVKTVKTGESAAPVYDASNGFGLFDPSTPVKAFELPPPCADFKITDLYAPDLDRVQAFYDAFDAAFHEHRHYEYAPVDWYYEVQSPTALLGEGRLLVPLRNADFFRRENTTLDDYPLADLWRKTMADFGADAAFVYPLATMHRFGRFDWLPDAEALLASAKGICEITEKAKYGYKTRGLIFAMVKEFPRDEIFSLARSVAYRLFPLAETCAQDNEKAFADMIVNWFGDMNACAEGDESFREYFELVWQWCNSKTARTAASSPLSVAALARATAFGLIGEADAIRHILTAPKESRMVRELTDPACACRADAFHPGMEAIREKICSRIVEIESRRGDLPTAVSRMAADILRFAGVRHFVDILSRCGSDPFERNPGSGGEGETWTKKAMLSRLLRACHPAKGEDEKSLRALLVDKRISEKRLIEGAMVAPQWIGIVGKYLGWQGLESACWYFHAHVNEHFSSGKETMVARFSDIAPPDFNDGAFDIAWFEEAYATLGPERFALVYEAAKYISVGANHRRSQLFADAATGRLKRSDVEREVTEKRAKNYVLCYGLVPLDKRNKTKDALHRYEVLQQFLKESRQFGAQRRESESRAVQIATENLARNAGYASATRFVWAMEGEKLESISPYLSKKNLDGTDIWIGIGSDGRAELKAGRGEKMLSDVPAKLKKDPYIVEVKTVLRSLLDQHSRARLALERAMERGEEFEPGEPAKLSAHPVIGPLLENLVFKAGDDIGYLSDLPAKSDSGALVIAHPVDLYESGRWQEFRRDIFDRRIVQPFKQVFRELYLPNADELADGATESGRYAGHQVQPQRGIALLKTRGWTVHYEEGLQRVFRRENLIAEICAAADWFSPADIEPPTLETVRFFTRKDYKPVALADVPKKIFSEVMRDVDLMVSVAHVGGVDPEASHSTIEMRRAIAAEAARLFRLDNVKFGDSHAIVTGTRGEYSIHLGSAIVHKMAGGALHILAVPSQHRGRLFLPFLDEDPRTAEVVSKILLFAEDGKIKDPAILDQL